MNKTLSMRSIRQYFTSGLGLLIALVVFPQISETIYTPALPAVAKGLSAHVHWVEATLAIYFLGFAVGVALFGAASDWIGRRKTMLIGLAVYLFSCLACSLSGSVEALLFWRFTQAFGASVGSVITQTIVRDLYEGMQRGRIFSVISGALAFSPALGPLLGGYLSELAGWRANFWALLAIGLFLFVWCCYSLPETRPPQAARPDCEEFKTLMRRMFSSRKLLGHILIVGASNGILFSFYEEAPFVFVSQLGLRPGLYGLFGLLIAFGTIVSARMTFLLSGKYAAETIIRLGCGIACIGGLSLTWLQYLGLFTLASVPFTLCLCSLFVIFFGIGMVIPISLSQALRDYQDMAGTAGSLFGAAYYLFIAAATWGMSALHNGTNWPLPVYLTALCFILALGSAMIFSSAHTEGLKSRLLRL